MRRVSERAKRALRTFAWQSLGFAVVFGLLAIGIYRVEDTRQQGNQTTERIEVIEHVEPIDLLRTCLRTPKCRRLFLHPERVQVESGEVQASPRQLDVGRDALQSPSTRGHPPELGPRAGGREDGTQPPDAGSDGAPAPRNPGNDPTPAPPSPGASAPSAPPIAAPTSPPPQPGASEETPAPQKEQGVQACVDLVVSACVGVPSLLP